MNEQIAGGQRPRDAAAEERRSQLLDVALELFSEKGYDATAIKDIALRAGVAPGLIYHYFSGKEELLLQVVEERGFKADMQAILLPAYDRPAVEVLPEAARAYYNLLGEKEHLCRIVVRESMTNKRVQEAWIQMISEGVQLMARYLAARVGAGELRPHNTEVSARMLLHPVAMLRLTGASAEHVQDIVQCLLMGITAHEVDAPVERLPNKRAELHPED